MVPEPSVARRAVGLAREHGADTVWFGAAAPLALLGPRLRRRAGVERVLASSHGHEVGWSMLPAARQALRRIGRDADVVTTVSRYTRARVASAFGATAALEPLPPGIDTRVFRPDPDARAALRRRHGLGAAPVVSCVSRLVARKGQDTLIRALPPVRDARARHAAAPGGRRARRGHGCARWRRPAGSRTPWCSPAPCPPPTCPPTTPWATCSRCRAAPAGAAWTSKAWASRCWRRPLPGYRWWRAAPAARRRPCGRAAPGTSSTAATPPRSADALVGLLADPDRAARFGAAGRDWMRTAWHWEGRAARLEALLRSGADQAGCFLRPA